MESQHFIFDGKKSSDMDLYIMRISTDFTQVPFVGDTNINEEKVGKKTIPYFYGVERGNIEFSVQLFLVDKNMQPKEWTPKERYRIGKWLIHDTYKEFQTSDDLGKKYYAIVNPQGIYLTGTKGYMEVTFKTNSPYAWSPIYIESFDLSDNTTSRIIKIENKSNILKHYRPKIEVELVDNETNIQLKNLSNGGKVFGFEGLYPNEIISIDNENEFIKSNIISSNPFKKFNREWLELVYGDNRIEVTGKCKIRVKSQFPIAQ